MSFWFVGSPNTNMLLMDPATVSNEPAIRCPPSQLSSMKRTIGGLIGHGVIDKVRPRVRRNDQERKPWTIAATTLRMRGTVVARQRGSRVAAESRTIQHVLRSLRLVHDLSQLMVVPAVGIIVGDDHGSAIPIRLGLQEIDHLR